MTGEETREQTVLNMAIEIFFQIGFYTGIAFQKEHREDAWKAFKGGELSRDGDSMYQGALYGKGCKTLPELFQRTIETARKNLQEAQDDENVAFLRTIKDLKEHPEVRQLLEGKDCPKMNLV